MEKSLNGIPISKVLCSYLNVAGPISQLVFKSVDKKCVGKNELCICYLDIALVNNTATSATC